MALFQQLSNATSSKPRSFMTGRTLNRLDATHVSYPADSVTAVRHCSNVTIIITLSPSMILVNSDLQNLSASSSDIPMPFRNSPYCCRPQCLRWWCSRSDEWSCCMHSGNDAFDSWHQNSHNQLSHYYHTIITTNLFMAVLQNGTGFTEEIIRSLYLLLLLVNFCH